MMTLPPIRRSAIVGPLVAFRWLPRVQDVRIMGQFEFPGDGIDSSCDGLDSMPCLDNNDAAALMVWFATWRIQITQTQGKEMEPASAQGNLMTYGALKMRIVAREHARLTRLLTLGLVLLAATGRACKTRRAVPRLWRTPQLCAKCLLGATASRTVTARGGP